MSGVEASAAATQLSQKDHASLLALSDRSRRSCWPPISWWSAARAVAFLFNAPVEWADDVARGLMVGSSFFGAASALARSENLGVAFFGTCCRQGCDPSSIPSARWLVTVIAAYVASTPSSSGPHRQARHGLGLPLEFDVYPMGAGALL